MSLYIMSIKICSINCPKDTRCKRRESGDSSTRLTGLHNGSPGQHEPRAGAELERHRHAVHAQVGRRSERGRSDEVGKVFKVRMTQRAEMA